MGYPISYTYFHRHFTNRMLRLVFTRMFGGGHLCQKRKIWENFSSIDTSSTNCGCLLVNHNNNKIDIHFCIFSLFINYRTFLISIDIYFFTFAYFSRCVYSHFLSTSNSRCSFTIINKYSIYSLLLLHRHLFINQFNLYILVHTRKIECSIFQWKK